MANSVAYIPIKKVGATQIEDVTDILATEEPLEIRLVYGEAQNRIQKSISVTMRTPGQDFELATGFLFTEGIIQSAADIISIKHCNGPYENIVKVELQPTVMPDILKLERNFYTTSSCGVCGKSSIEAVKTVCSYPSSNNNMQVLPETLYRLPAILRETQDLFAHTGGIHACALFDVNGRLWSMREDVGRHNALDKLIGAALNAAILPLAKQVLLLSGRASFELIQKAAMAGITFVAAIGAPSTLAVSIAQEYNMTLTGFLRGERFNIYSGEQRILI